LLLGAHVANTTPKRKKRPRPEKPVPKPLGRHQSAAPNVGPVTKRLIGQVIVEWANLEAALDDMIWHILELADDDGKALTKRCDAATKIAIINDIAPRHLDANPLEALQDTLGHINAVREDRNLIVHSVWGMLRPNNVPIAMALRPKSGPNEVMSETFPHERLRQIASDTKTAKNALIEIMKQLGPWPERST
jgi:hypothetical protein